MTKGQLHWLPHSDNPIYAGVRLRCLIPSACLRRKGVESRVIRTDAPLPRQGVLIVQAKWLLDAGEPQELRARAGRLRSAAKSGVRLVLDSFDNYFLNESGSTHRAALLNAYREGLDSFRLFTVSSPGLVPLIKNELPADAEVRVVGDPLEAPNSNRVYEGWMRRHQPGRWRQQIAALQELREHRRRRKTSRQLIWFGNHGSQYASGGMSELETLVPDLERIAKVVAFDLNVVSNSQSRYREVLGRSEFSHRYRDWDRVHFLSLLAEHDLALLPTRINHFTTAKSSNRLLQCLSLGVPVMTDALPDYLPWSEFCAIGQWQQLAQHISDPSALRRRALDAAPILRSEYSADSVAHRWLAAVSELLSP